MKLVGISLDMILTNYIMKYAVDYFLHEMHDACL